MKYKLAFILVLLLTSMCSYAEIRVYCHYPNNEIMYTVRGNEIRIYPTLAIQFTTTAGLYHNASLVACEVVAPEIDAPKTR